jgi:ABC-type glutathione transport system ATPase component
MIIPAIRDIFRTISESRRRTRLRYTGWLQIQSGIVTKSLISNRERTVVIVSHSLDTIADLCDKVMWMHEGKLIEIGTPDEVLPRYLEFMK